jgi:hypothetical protein
MEIYKPEGSYSLTEPASHEFIANNTSNNCNGVEIANRNQENINYEEASTTDL